MRYLIAILGVLVVVGGLGAVKAAQIGKLISFGKAAQAAGPPPEAVSSAVAEEQVWEATLTAVGSVASGKGVAIANDAPGVVTRIHFESGAVVKQGQVLVELDTSVERAQLASAIARRELAMTTAGRTRALGAQGAVSQAQVDADEAQLRTATTDVEAIQAQIARKIVRAPFAGRLGIRHVNLGQYLPPGTAVTTLESVEAVHVDFTLPQQRLSEIAVGMPIRISVDGADGAIEGKIGAIDPAVDGSTRHLKIRGDFAAHDDRLRAGMFVNVSVILPEKRNVIVIPATALVHAPYGDSVFVIDETSPQKVARQQFVRVAESRGDFVAVADGLKAGDRVVTAGAFKLRNGAAVVIDDTKQAKPELAPKPANR